MCFHGRHRRRVEHGRSPPLQPLRPPPPSPLGRFSTVSAREFTTVSVGGLGLPDATITRRYARGQVHPPQGRVARLRLLYPRGSNPPRRLRCRSGSPVPHPLAPATRRSRPLLVIADDRTAQAGPEVIATPRALLLVAVQRRINDAVLRRMCRYGKSADVSMRSFVGHAVAA